MTDAMTKTRMQVDGIGTDYSSLLLQLDQVEDVRHLLDRHGVQYTLDNFALSMNGDPETTIIHLKPRTDGRWVQQILDSVP